MKNQLAYRLSPEAMKTLIDLDYSLENITTINTHIKGIIRTCMLGDGLCTEALDSDTISQTDWDDACLFFASRQYLDGYKTAEYEAEMHKIRYHRVMDNCIRSIQYHDHMLYVLDGLGKTDKEKKHTDQLQNFEGILYTLREADPSVEDVRELAKIY